MFTWRAFSLSLTFLAATALAQTEPPKADKPGSADDPLLKRYKQNLAAYRAALHDFCSRRGVSYLFTSNQVPFDRLVLSYLRQRGLVK